jgi:hypothetical protein
VTYHSDLSSGRTQFAHGITGHTSGAVTVYCTRAARSSPGMEHRRFAEVLPRLDRDAAVAEG